MTNPIVYGGVGSPQSVYETSPTQYHRVGERGHLGDRVFYYARHTGTTALATNVLCQSPATVANHVLQTGTLSSVSTGIGIDQKVFNATVGATAGTIANQYADGYFSVSTGTGSGFIQKIRGHALIASAAANTFELYEGPRVAVASGATWSLLPNPWADIIITPATTQTNLNCGVNLIAFAANASATTSQYGWIQTWGPCLVLGDAADTVIGNEVLGVSGTAGTTTITVSDATPEITQKVGISILANSATAFQAVFLQIAP